MCTHEIDEVGYVQLDARGAELLFQVSPRGRKSSVGLASNLPFSEWGGIIADARLVAAVIDWVTSRRLLERRVRGHTAAEISAHPSTNSS